MSKSLRFTEGEKVKELTVIRYSDRKDSKGNRYVVVRCSCGDIVEMAVRTLTGKNKVKSCGHIRKQVASQKLKALHKTGWNPCRYMREKR